MCLHSKNAWIIRVQAFHGQTEVGRMQKLTVTGREGLKPVKYLQYIFWVHVHLVLRPSYIFCNYI